MKSRKKMTVNQMVLIALAACINTAGGQAALALRLPVYLDSIGTILAGILLGPVYGMLPNLLSGILMGMTTDIYSLYFAPVGMVTGFMAGLASRRMPELMGRVRGLRLFLAAALITVPGTIVSSLICAGLFGGITSSGSTVLVQLLSHTPLGMTASIFLVQVITDLADRTVSLFLASAAAGAVPDRLKQASRAEPAVLKKGEQLWEYQRNGTAGSLLKIRGKYASSGAFPVPGGNAPSVIILRTTEGTGRPWRP